ncbi:hypothetical protein GGTG_05796 [Gaeumannomyces tritici R3-111a-1]|uniref:Uncharacterized protein n=1 Tax=Gaeumannomyces tritici (strain R3-111a-1) TaxID=644352 RepID=J3NWY5_GAET3|nr:hypothetical protein GGTG_05796 [Gaeumannomyces tritici R3-111a-1]EJT75867.1 hypothetical protein GGTG_05796 [Gaeumannomyces tritici R3-111a-1]
MDKIQANALLKYRAPKWIKTILLFNRFRPEIQKRVIFKNFFYIIKKLQAKAFKAKIILEPYKRTPKDTNILAFKKPVTYFKCG